MIRQLMAFAALLAAAPAAWAAEAPSEQPKPIPETRPEMKQMLEALKERTPRLPLPEDGPGGVNNGRMRAAYLPESWSSRGRRRGRDNDERLDYLFTVPCFWVVSRGNNCHYCLGHQELKLRAAGLDDDTIAALDSDWSRFDPRLQTALAFARKLTLEPQLVDDADIKALQEHLSDDEVIELVHTVARFNSTNRWTDGLGIPQDRSFRDDRGATLTTPTSDAFQSTTSIAAPTVRAPRSRTPSVSKVRAAIAEIRARAPRVSLPSVQGAKETLADAIGDSAPAEWERASAALGPSGAAQVKAWNTIMSDDHLTPRLKAELAFITAVNNHAWYAAAHAADRLARLGATDQDLAALLEKQDPTTTGTAAAYHLAAKSTTDPHLVADADIAHVREHYSDAETAQIMHVVCMANWFDRFTEPLALPVEQEVAK